jgi:SAM-dependent methyltransferase
MASIIYMEISYGTFIFFQRYKKNVIFLYHPEYINEILKNMPEPLWLKKDLQMLFTEIDIQKTDRILYLGCGDGIITNELAEKVLDGYVMGVDISPDVRYASSHFMETENNIFSLLTLTHRYSP